MPATGPQEDSGAPLAGSRGERPPDRRGGRLHRDGDGRPQRHGTARAPDRRRETGAAGEQIARRHLERLDFAILDRNVRTRWGEIDLVARSDEALVFVEVKTRRARPGAAGVHIAPLDGLRHSQRSRLRRLATAWLQSTAPRPPVATIRFDAIGVLLDDQGRLLRLDHVEGAW